LIEFESINVTGFPSKIQIDINKPKLYLELSAKSGLLNNLQQSNSTGSDVSQKKITVEYSSKDKISVSSDILSKDFFVSALGDSISKTIVNEEKPIETSSSGTINCHLAISNKDNLPWNAPQAFADKDSFLKAFRKFDCHANDVSGINNENGQLLASTELLDFLLSNETNDQINHNINFVLNIKNSLATPALDSLAMSILPTIYDILQVPENKREKTVNYSQYGTQNTKINITYSGPIDANNFASSPSMKFEIKEFDVKNALYEMTNKNNFSLIQSAAGRDLDFSLHSNAQYKEKFQEIAKKQVEKMLVEASSSKSGNIPELQSAVLSGKAPQLASLLVPNLYAVGKINFDIDVKAKGDASLTSGNLDINSFDIFSDKYGIKSKGNGVATKGKMPTGELKITCQNCDEMINDIGQYAINIDNILSEFRQPVASYVSRPLIDNFIKFLHAINENEAQKTKDVVVHLVAGENSRITVSGKEAMEVLGLFGTTVAPYLNPQPVSNVAPTK
ncbi:MAG: hypothetical protein WCJ33_04765, partial [Pseudomonadota bacterium]